MKNFYTGVLMLFSTVLFSQTSGGPDAYGYSWKSSTHSVNPPSYQWVDISVRGTEVDLLADDNIVGPFNIPGGFQFYWYPISQIYIGSNGYVSLSGGNMASPFPSMIPSSGGSNNWVAGHMADLNFDGVGNPAKCYMIANNDSIIVSYHNVPYWHVTTGYSGSNTFQIIFTKADKGIQLNFKSMSLGNTTSPVDCATGIENVTGALGLQTHIDVIPQSLTSVRYYYPATVTYSVKDAGIHWNSTSKDRGFFVPVSNAPITLKTNIANFGNQSLSAFTVTDSVTSYGTLISNGSAAVPVLLPGEDTTLTFSNPLTAWLPSILSYSTRIQGVTNDMVLANNRKVQKIIAINTNQAQYPLDYSDGMPDGAGISWNGGNGGVAVYIAPPKYPVQVNSASFYISGNNPAAPSGFSAILYDDNGVAGAPGTIIDSIYVAGSSVTTNSYNTVTFTNTPLYITSGGVYLVWYMNGPSVTLGRDLTAPISGQAYEILGNTWADYRDRLTEDFLMGINVSAAPLPVANYSVDSSNAPTLVFQDLSTNTPTSWKWYFGDGDSSSVQHPTHTYAQNGTYIVCLSVSNSSGFDSTCHTFGVSHVGFFETELSGINVYPNPAQGHLRIDWDGAGIPTDVKVFTALGTSLDAPWTTEQNHLDLRWENWAAGLYHAIVTMDNGATFRIRWMVL